MNQDDRINYIELFARDIGAAKTFYGTVFGWTFQDFGDEYCAFNDGQLDGGFRHGDACSSTHNGAALVVLYSSNLEACRDKVAANGGTVIEDIFSFPGGRRFQFTDPNGNELAVWSDS